MELMYLKVADKKWKGYTGILGMARFKDGVSVEMLPRHIRDRMAAAMPFIEIDSEGNEQPAGAQYRLIRESRSRAPIIEPLKRQTEGEKAAELAAAQVAAAKVPVLETRASLEAIAEKQGIKGLREIGKRWNVKHRSIPTLIEMILDAQEKAVAKRNKADTPAPAQAVEEPATDEAETIAPEVAADVAAAEALAAKEAEEFELEALKAAAASGDLAAAVNADEAAQE